MGYTMKLTETTLSSQIQYEGRIFTVTSDEVRLPDGKTAGRDVVHHRGGVAVVAADEHNNIVLVTQYRYSVGRELTEIVAGKREPDEEALVTGKRELAEEAGLAAEHWTLLTTMCPTPGYSSEWIDIFLADGLSEFRLPADEDEFLNVSRVPLQKALEMVCSGTLTDAKTQIGLLLAAQKLGISLSFGG